jgi:hypothetical protein
LALFQALPRSEITACSPAPQFCNRRNAAVPRDCRQDENPAFLPLAADAGRSAKDDRWTRQKFSTEYPGHV